MSAEIFTEKQKQEIKMILALAWSERGKEVEDVSKEINENMFPLSEQQIKDVDKIVEALIYGGGIQEQMSVPERLNLGVSWIMQKLQ